MKLTKISMEHRLGNLRQEL